MLIRKHFCPSLCITKNPGGRGSCIPGIPASTRISLLSTPRADSLYQNEEQNQSDILWGKIVSIKYVGSEHVYDIEVEGTHNFVANGIIAHNTYIWVKFENRTKMI
ncbi:hypothetical protein KJ636_01320 [Patescibacteria group bacterium]|nr:hypothetical protein [Patescibacteria group bacterium]